MTASGLKLTPIKHPTDQAKLPSTRPTTSIVARHERTPLNPHVKLRGAVGLQNSQEFLLFGQNKNLGYVEKRKASDLSVVAQTTVPSASTVWNATPSLEKDGEIITFFDSKNDPHLKPTRWSRPFNYLRFQLMDSATLATLSNAKTIGNPGAWSWLLFRPTNPPDNKPDSSYTWYTKPTSDESTMYINYHTYQDNCCFPKKNKYTEKRKISNPAQFSANSPDSKFVLIGDIADGKVGIRHKHWDWGHSGGDNYTYEDKLPISADQFKTCGWFSDSKHYFIITERTLRLFHINHLDRYDSDYIDNFGSFNIDLGKGLKHDRIQSIDIALDSNAYAAVTVADEPLITISHTDGSVKIYDVSDALSSLRENTLFRRSQTAKADLVETLVPSEKSRTEIKYDLASVCNDHKTTVLAHKQGTHELHRFVLNPEQSLHVPTSLQPLANTLPPELIRIIAKYNSPLQECGDFVVTNYREELDDLKEVLDSILSDRKAASDLIESQAVLFKRTSTPSDTTEVIPPAVSKNETLSM